MTSVTRASLPIRMNAFGAKAGGAAAAAAVAAPDPSPIRQPSSSPPPWCPTKGRAVGAGVGGLESRRLSYGLPMRLWQRTQERNRATDTPRGGYPWYAGDHTPPWGPAWTRAIKPQRQLLGGTSIS